MLRPETLNVAHLSIDNLKQKNDTNNNSEKLGDATRSEIKLKREIGLLNAVAITVGAIIGSGIFIAPKGILRHTGSIGVSLCMWVFCGFVALIGALCYAELGTTFPSAGAQYTYIYEAFGPELAFLSLWSHMIFTPMGYAIMALAFANYVTQPFFQTADDIPDSAIQLLAASAICFVTYLNCCDTKKTRNLWNGFMFLKIGPLLVIVIAGIYSFAAGNTKNFDDIWDNSKVTAGSLVFASFSGSFAYGGWNSMTSMMEELKEPNKNLPRAIVLSLFVVTVAYLLTNASYFVVLTPAEILSSDAVAVTFVDKLIGVWGWIVPIFVSISIFGTLSIHIMTGSRSCLVGSRCHQLPSFISLMTVFNKLPAPATIFLSFIALVFLVCADVYELIEFGAISTGFLSVTTVAALIYLRWKKPNIERPFKVSLVIPLVYLLVTILLLIIPIYVKPVTAGIGAILTLSGFPVYYIFLSRSRVHPKWIQLMNEKITVYIQKLLIAAKEDQEFE